MRTALNNLIGAIAASPHQWAEPLRERLRRPDADVLRLYAALNRTQAAGPDVSTEPRVAVEYTDAGIIYHEREDGDDDMVNDDILTRARHLARQDGITMDEALKQCVDRSRYFAETRRHDAADRRGQLDAPDEPRSFGDAKPDDPLADRYQRAVAKAMAGGLSMAAAHELVQRDPQFRAHYNRKFAQRHNTAS